VVWGAVSPRVDPHRARRPADRELPGANSCNEGEARLGRTHSRVGASAMSSFDTDASIRRLLGGAPLSRDETEMLFGALMDGALDEVKKTALIVALAVRGETAEEIAGATLAMRRRVIAIPHQLEDLVDTCGTGGDG